MKKRTPRGEDESTVQNVKRTIDVDELMRDCEKRSLKDLLI